MYQFESDLVVSPSGSGRTCFATPVSLEPDSVDSLRKQLVCADQQGALPAMFLYIAHSVYEGRTPRAERFLKEFGIEPKRFNACLKHTAYTSDLLKASSALFWGAGLRGVPSVKFGRTTFTLTTADHLFGLDRCEAEELVS